MIIQSLFNFLFGLIDNTISILPVFPQIELFSNYDFSEFDTILSQSFAILGYFLPVNVILLIIASELLINHFNLVTAVFYRIKHSLPFI